MQKQTNKIFVFDCQKSVWVKDALLLELVFQPFPSKRNMVVVFLSVFFLSLSGVYGKADPSFVLYTRSQVALTASSVKSKSLPFHSSLLETCKLSTPISLVCVCVCVCSLTVAAFGISQHSFSELSACMYHRSDKHSVQLVCIRRTGRQQLKLELRGCEQSPEDVKVSSWNLSRTFSRTVRGVLVSMFLFLQSF